jgi:exodeoxyribonuclease V gamma subunit
MQKVSAKSLDGLLPPLLEFLAPTGGDPLVLDTCIVPDLATRRWLSQQFARQTGVAAGVRFVTFGSFESELAESLLDEPTFRAWRRWSPEGLRGLLHRAVAAGPVTRFSEYLAQVSEPQAALWRLGVKFARYAQYREELPAQLRAGEFGWQGELWRRARELNGGFDGAEAAAALSAAILPGSISGRVALFAPRPLPHARARLIDRVAEVAELQCFELTPAASFGEKPEGCYEFHFSHGRLRQVEVLRDVLAQLFQADESLEPRDVVVITPQVRQVAAAVASIKLQAHPAASFRLQTTAGTSGSRGGLTELLLAVLAADHTRFTVAELLQLAAIPAVARKFGFEDLERLDELAQAAEIRFGLDAAHLQGFGLQAFPQNTWAEGLKRLLLGITLSADELATAGTALPVDDEDSGDATLVLALTRFVDALSSWNQTLETATTFTGWVGRAQASLAELALPVGDERRELEDITRELSDLPEAEAGPEMDRRDAAWLIEFQLANRRRRDAFGNGSLTVCDIGEAERIPRKVSVLLGWDADVVPARDPWDGDDLLALDPQPGDPVRSARDQQALFDVVQATSEKLVVICADRSEATNLPVPLSGPINSLLEHAGGTPIRHSLHAFSPEAFQSPASSFDPVAFQQAELLVQARARGVTAAAPAPLRRTSPPLTEVELAELISYFKNAASWLLREAAGLSFGDSVVKEGIELEVDGLAQWSLGDWTLQQRLLGHQPEQIVDALWRSGRVPPRQLGAQVLDTVLGDVAGLCDAATSALGPGWEAAAREPLPIQVSVGGVRVHGQLATVNGQLAEFTYSQLRAKQLIGPWLKYLAAKAAGADVALQLIGRKCQYSSHAGEPAVMPNWPPLSATQAQELLGRFIEVFKVGRDRPLPIEPELAQAAAEHQHDRPDQLERHWKYVDKAWLELYPELSDYRDDREPTLFPGSAPLFFRLAEALYSPMGAES